jgi:hypothetical protein
VLEFSQPLPGAGVPRTAAGQAFRTLRLVVSPTYLSYIHCCRNSTFTSTTAQEHFNTGLSLLHYQLYIRLYNKTDAQQLRNLQTWRRVAIAKHDNTTRASHIILIAYHINHNGSRAPIARRQEPYAGRRARTQSYVESFNAPTTARSFTNHTRITDEILVERRCLGQTELKVKPGQIGTSNATKPDNLGVLDYAHLRVPLPSDLSSSGIFIKGPNRKYPEAYFLMVRGQARKRLEGKVANTKTEAIKRRIHQRHGHVQGRFPLCISGGGGPREGVHQVVPRGV